MVFIMRFETLQKKEKRTISRILKVNHAGEYGAIRIYRAQAFVAKIFYPDFRDFLKEFLDHEIEHCKLFRQAMYPRDTRPCRSMFLWNWGGFLLGLITALLGRNAILICTAAVERTVHKHMVEQLHFLKGRDQDFFDLVKSIQVQEIEHLNYAEERLVPSGALAKVINKVVCVSTDIVIWLSTWGDVTRMRHELEVKNEVTS